MHSMQDWTIQHRLNEFNCTDGHEFRARLYTAEPRLKAIRDYANSTKHAGTLKGRNPVLVKVERAGAFSREFSHAFDRVRLELHVQLGVLPHHVRHRDGSDFLELDQTLEECLAFWTSLYRDKSVLVPILQPEKEGQPDDKADTQVLLPDEINSTQEQLAIAEHQTDAAASMGTPAMTYLAATAIAPLEHWGYEDLKRPMEFLTKRDFRRYLRTESPYIGPIWELAHAAKSGANAVSAAGRLVIALKDGESLEAIDTFRRAIAFWKYILAGYTGYRRE